ncbi:Sodium/calcium exchanger protein-domain-containing protein [Zychaea mexicana]|uniref:Sodium/calcium exchanger protein-domain-containing protein n=1 Tax=Zychaea mexicana TaxID=64656 RepID=UPI0022FF3AD1|nr:Sodium/calcium exchanger protein-domain-containing protein [Zychaea mexicana]KAI9489953.1 Sodium/calcium exchanger protein-domain-containing protein [Zychaea mexicana]
MNKRHPFGLPIWKPALYKKSRSVVRRANSALHSSPSSSPELFLNPGNILWLLIFGWWLALVMFIISVVLIVVPPEGYAYARVMRELAYYLLWPFGRYVEHHGEVVIKNPLSPATSRSATISHVEDDGSSIVSIVTTDDGSDEDENDEETGLLGRSKDKKKKRKRKGVLRSLIDIVKTGPAGCMYYLLFFIIATPLMFIVSAICWLCVITIPMSKLNFILLRHLRRHPLSLRFKSSPSGQAHMQQTGRPAVILLCTYQAIGLQYYKYTYDGINIMFINLMPLVFFVIFDEYVLKHYFPDSFVTKPAVVFALSLASVIPLSYFIGMGVSSVSAQSSMGIGAFLNASFGSIIEIILYAVALMSGKSALVEGALIGSVMAGVLLMPGCSMISGGFKRKEQRFNAKSAEVTSTMLIMAIIGALTPTLFYQMFGSFELRCAGCPDTVEPGSGGTIACSRCYYDQMNPTIDPVYQNSVKPLMWFCAAILPSAYVIGIVFSLRTHVDMVWKKPEHSAPLQHGSYYQKLMPGQFISHLIHHPGQQQQQQQQQHTDQQHGDHQNGKQPQMKGSIQLPYSPVVAMAPSSSTDGRHPSPHSINTTIHPSHSESHKDSPVIPAAVAPLTFVHAKEPEEEEEEEAAGHDSPNWSKFKSFTILFGCTLLYSIIAEVLVDTVDEVMDNLAVDEKFLGLTLFALVPNITEFMNAISFALYGNIVLSMEIGSAYALQVCLIQIPAMVAFSLWYNWGKEELARYSFSLVFPRWDVICVIFSVFLLTYTYQEGKSNYFKGSILIMSYCVLLAGFYFIPPFTEKSILIGFDPSVGAQQQVVTAPPLIP